jgi:hypothetical protein
MQRVSNKPFLQVFQAKPRRFRLKALDATPEARPGFTAHRADFDKL